MAGTRYLVLEQIEGPMGKTAWAEVGTVEAGGRGEAVKALTDQNGEYRTVAVGNWGGVELEVEMEPRVRAREIEPFGERRSNGRAEPDPEPEPELAPDGPAEGVASKDGEVPSF